MNFRSSSEWVYDLEPMTHVVSNFTECQTGEIADLCFKVVTGLSGYEWLLAKLMFVKVNFHCYRSNVF